MDLSLKESQPLTLSALTFHSSTQRGIPPNTHHITLLSLHLLSFQDFKSSPEGRNIQKTEKKIGKFQLQTGVAVANHKRVECHLLVHNLSSLVFNQHQSIPLPLLLPLHPPTDAGSRHPLTDSPYVSTHAQRISHFVSRPETCKVAQGCSALRQLRLRFSTGSQI